MKSKELFCASQASTAICSSMDHRSILRPGPKPVDRPVNRLGDPPKAPCYSQIPVDPSRLSYYHKGRKSTSTNKQTEILRRKSSADVEDLSSSKYLLSDKPFMDYILDSDQKSIVPSQPLRNNIINNINNNNSSNYKRLNLDGFPAFRSLSTRSYESPVFKPSYEDDVAQKKLPVRLSDHLSVQKSSSPSSNNRQVVELRVSIHCKGCEGKLRKYISRMEGVTSFSIDLATKKVTIIGDVTPLSVLTSISKVKYAQLWPSPTSSSSSSSSSQSPSVSFTR